MTPSPKAAAAKIRKLSQLRPTLALILGSGFNHVVTKLAVDARVSYAKIPGFPKPTVAGHTGELFIGRLGGTPIYILSGRAHYYEGHPMERVTFATRTLAELGVTDLLLTNAAGGINKKFRAGDFMRLTDHINLMGANPLRGTRGFVDMTAVYDPDLGALLERASKMVKTGSTKLSLRRGVYLAVSGPSYETPAEIKAFARLGADAVGMSTVPEAMAARAAGMRVAALSCITNLAAGRSPNPLSHREVLETAEKVKPLAASMLESFAREYRLYGSDRKN